MASILFLLLLLTLCCQTGSLFMVDPTEQTQYTEGNAIIDCHFTEQACRENPTWSGPAVSSLRASPVHDRQRGISTLTIRNLTEDDEGHYDCSCRGQPTQTSNLIIHRAPSFDHVPRDQTFYRRETAFVMCRADLGDPAIPMKWTKNGFVVPNLLTPRIHNSSYVLRIDSISDNDTGIYECEFQTSKFSRIFRSINVTVTDPPLEFIQPSASINVPFGDPLNLECATNPPAVNYSWSLPRRNGSVERTNNITIHFPPDTHGGFAGFYKCTATTSSGETGTRIVDVQQLNIPPRLVEREKTVITSEGDTHELHLRLNFPVLEQGLNLHWTRNNEVVDFSPRIFFYAPQDGLRIEISNASINDAGTYLLTISNNHGFDELNVIINVNRLPREKLKLKFNVPCSTLEGHTREVGAQVWRQYCDQDQHRCEGLRMDSTTLTCRDAGLTVLTLSVIVSRPSASLQDIRNQEFSVTVNTANTAQLRGTVCQSGESEDSCGPTTSPPPSPTSPPGTSVGSGPMSATIIVVSLTLIMAVVVALLLAIFFWRSRRNHCHGDVVGGRSADSPNQVVVHNSNCTYSRKEPPDSDPSMISVHEPFLPQAPGQPPRRPQNLLIRSLSHPSSRRTPLRTV